MTTEQRDARRSGAEGAGEPAGGPMKAVAVRPGTAGREHFEAGVRDLAVMHAQDPGWLPRLITHVVSGLDDHARAFSLLESGAGVIKIVVELA